MKKITQNLTNVKAWQSIIFAFLFLFSLTINAQEVGDEFLANPGVNTTAIDAATGYDAAGTFNNNGNGNYGGWTAGTGGAYATATTNNGDCHSPDRMFRLFKTGGTDGQFINQIVTALPAGNYNYGFWNKWDATSSNDEALPTWSAEDDVSPKFTIKVQDETGAWVTVHTHIPAEPTEDMTWVEETGTWTNEETRDVRVMFYKNGGTTAAPTNLNNLWYVDTTTLNYASALDTSSGCDFSISLSDSYGDGYGTGNSVDVTVGGVLVLDDLTLSSGYGPESTSFNVNEGDEIVVTYNDGGSYNGENSYEVFDNTGAVIASESGAGGGFSDAGPANTTLTANCITEPAMSVTATTGVASATFSFDISNFTVGAAAGEGDGHIHWSIFAASDLNTPIYENVMVYSTDDLTLSPLPNGDHVIVFSLVDPNHQPLDPTVEATVEFSTFDATVDCDSSYTYTYGDNESGILFTSTNPNGGAVTVTMTGQTETCCDEVVITDGAGNELYNYGGDHTGVSVTSEDGIINVSIVSDSSYSPGDDGLGNGTEMTFDVTCAVPTTTAVTFNVDMSQYDLAEGDTVHVNGEFTGWCGSCGNEMSDDDGDGIYTITFDLEQGSYFWKYTVNGWDAQEGFNEAIEGCTAQNGNNFDRQVVVGAEAMELSYCWNSCEAAGSCTPVEPVLMPIDFENENVSYFWNDFGGAATSVIANPDASGVNTSATVAKSIKTAGSETWAGTFIVLDESLDFSTLTSLAVDVWTPDGGELVNLKVEKEGESYAIEINQPTTVASGWETLTYDLSDQDLSLDYNKIVLFFDFNVGGDDTAYYFDNIRLVEAGSTAGIDPGCNDFESGIEGWTTIEANGLTSNWLLNNPDSVADGSVSNMGHGYADGTIDYNDWLISPAYNTSGLSSPVVSYREYGNWLNYVGEHNVYYSIDYDGDALSATWELVYDTVDLEFGEDAWVDRAHSIPNADNIVIAFQYTGADGSEWNIDDVCIQEDTLSTIDTTVLEMRIYPNPVDGNFVTIQTPVNGVKYVEVFDITGKRLMNTSLSSDTLDVSSFSTGVYLVKLTVEGQSKTSKLIIR